MAGQQANAKSTNPRLNVGRPPSIKVPHLKQPAYPLYKSSRSTPRSHPSFPRPSLASPKGTQGGQGRPGRAWKRRVIFSKKFWDSVRDELLLALPFPIPIAMLG